MTLTTRRILAVIAICATPSLAFAQSDDAMETGSEDAAEKAQDIATDGIDSSSEALMLDEEGLVEVLSVEGFDYDEAVQAIETADIEDSQKATLLAGMDAARDDPEALAEVLERAVETIMASREVDG